MSAWGREGLLYHLLDQRLQVGGAAGGLGIWRDWRSRGRVRGVALLPTAKRVEVLHPYTVGTRCRT